MTDTTSAQPMTTREAADKLGTDPKTLRRFLRDPKSTFVAVGQGGRYGFTPKEIPSLRKRFNTWSKELEAKRPVKAAPADDAAKVDA